MVGGALSRLRQQLAQWYQRPSLRLFRGQSTLEYLLVLLAFGATLAAFGALWRAALDGGLFGLLEQAVSHAMDSSFAAGLKDIALY